MKYNYMIVPKAPADYRMSSSIEANDETAAIPKIAQRHDLKPLGDGWYETVGGNAVEIQVKS